MLSITLMRTSFVKSYLVVPILSLLTIFVLPLKMYWDNALYAKWIFNHVTQIDQATHVLIKGRSGNTDICKLENLTDTVTSLI